jgi:phenylacetic acid degradation operon negative regulatory protein
MPPLAPTTDQVDVRPLTARSAVLSLLLGVHPPTLPVRDLVRAAQVFGINDSTLRVTLTRMVAAGELERDNSTYRLSGRILERQHRQDQALGPRTKAWRGGWEIVVITASGRNATDRARLRGTLEQQRLAELREGVWLRPDNLRRPVQAPPEVITSFVARGKDDPSTLARQLWDLDRWARTGTALLARFEATRADQGLRLATAAAMVRHLLTDPILPAELTPAGWPSPALRTTYADYQAELIELAQLGRPSRD